MSGEAAQDQLQLRAGLAGTRARSGAAILRAPAWTLTALLGVVYLIAAPASADLAAASYRSYLFGRAGFTVWDNSWYGGHHLPAYSVLAPALGWLIGPRLLATVSMVIATALFCALIEGRVPHRATRLAGLWFALGAAVALLSCRVPFNLGLAIGLGALLLAQRGRRVGAVALALVCALASPVAGGFLALAALAWWLAARGGRFALWLAAAALTPIALLAVAFPEGGFQPFVASAFYPALLGVLLVAALIPAARRDARRTLRDGALLYALALIGAYALRTPAGGNVDRLAALAAGPVAACALAYGAREDRWRAYALVALAPFLLYWQINAPLTDFLAARSDPSVHASYYAPLLGELERLHVGYGARPARIEVVPTVDHWEARFVAAHIAIARGWERQLDNRRNALFYASSAPDAARMRAWLSDEGISLIALPDAPLDYSGKAEAALLRSGELPYAREIWRSAHWRLFEVQGATGLARSPALLTQLDDGSFTLLAPSAGTFVARVRYTPYWRLSGHVGCIGQAAGGWTALRVPRGGRFHAVIDFSFARVLDHSPRCG